MLQQCHDINVLTLVRSTHINALYLLWMSLLFSISSLFSMSKLFWRFEVGIVATNICSPFFHIYHEFYLLSLMYLD
jgi:hypothetical protein